MTKGQVMGGLVISPAGENLLYQLWVPVSDGAQEWVTVLTALPQVWVHQDFLATVLANRPEDVLGRAQLLDGYLILTVDNGTVTYRLAQEVVAGYCSATKIKDTTLSTDTKENGS